ncbi:helix-turn-helix transcriptional regulator [Gordonia sp. NPDC003950]
MTTEVMDTKEAAAYVCSTPRTLEQFRYLGKGPKYYKLGQKVVYRRSDLDAWLDAHAVTPEASA